MAAALTLASPACASTLPGRNGPIVVATSENGHAEIDLISRRGRVRTAFRTSLGDAIFTHPTISPDARRVI